LVNFDLRASGYSIRSAGPADAKALRMLLPATGPTGASFVAVDGRHGLVIGGAAATREPRREPWVGPGVALHVIEPCRRSGVGRRLVDHLAQAARAGGAQALYGAKRVDINGLEMRAWQALGFAVCETVEHHRLSLARVEAQLDPLIERIRGRARIPSSARIIPLYQADLLAVVQLHLDNLGGERHDLLRRLRGQGPDGFLPHYSKVLLVGERVSGAVLGHRKDADTIVVDANIVHERFRGGWANVWLKLETLRGALPLGIKDVEFTTFDHYRDTRVFAKRFGGVTIGASALVVRRIDATAAAPDFGGGE